MAIATHVIKVKGVFDNKKWSEEKLEEYVDRKIQEIESSYHPDLELFKIENNTVEVWVFITAFPAEVEEKIIGTWLQNHIKEKGITVKEFQIVEIVSLIDCLDSGKQIFIHTP